MRLVQVAVDTYAVYIYDEERNEQQYLGTFGLHQETRELQGQHPSEETHDAKSDRH